nr:hypothetical protein [Bdellovibrionales bacterium]
MRPVFKLHILIVALLGFSALASAEVTLSETRTWRRARLINGGQQVWSFRTSYQKITDRYSNDGSVEPMGQRYSRALTWGQLVNAENSEEGRADMRAYMNQRRLNDDQIAATARYEVEREDLGVAAEWAYGLTKRWMIGAQIPLTYRRTRVSSRIEMTPQLAQGGGDINQKSVLKFKNDELRGKVNELAERELANSGYDEIPDEQQSLDWGDVALLSQFALYESSDVTWSLQQLVRFPTAQSPSVAEYIQTTSDDGNMDVGLTSLADYRLRRWTFGGRLGYVAQLPDTTRMRVS